jgi:phage terminase Nu1 subunit (DNA packaging protein)
MADLKAPESAAAPMPQTEVDDTTLARVLRCDEAAIRRYARAGLIRRSRGGKYPLFPSIGAVVEHLREAAAGRGTGEAMREGAQLKAAQRRLVELRYQQMDGQLLALADVETVWADLVTATKWLFLALPERARAAWPQLGDQGQAVMAQLCAAMLREVALKGRPHMPGPSDAEDAEADADA